MADSAHKRNIPIKLGDFSVIDTEFASIRERFDSEMRKMEDEMSKFRSDLMNREANYFESTTRWVWYFKFNFFSFIWLVFHLPVLLLRLNKKKKKRKIIWQWCYKKWNRSFHCSTNDGFIQYSICYSKLFRQISKIE